MPRLQQDRRDDSRVFFLYEDLLSNYAFYHCSFASIFRMIRACWEISEFQTLITPRKKIYLVTNSQFGMFEFCHIFGF